MKKISGSLFLKYCGFAGLVMVISCKNSSAPLSATETAIVKDSVTRLAANISHDVTAKGPAAWLKYFENAPGFFMASNGTLVFKDYNTAKTYTLDTVVKNFKKISLSWTNLSADPLTATYASLGGDFHEDIVLANGQSMSIGGYVTVTAHFDGNRWMIRNMNWAIKTQGK